jgi:hypothetical protein
MTIFSSKKKDDGWNEAPFDAKQHEAEMERTVLWIVAGALLFIGLWWAFAYFVCPEKGMLLIDKLLPVATLLIGYLSNEAVKRSRKKSS